MIGHLRLKITCLRKEKIPEKPAEKGSFPSLSSIRDPKTRLEREILKEKVIIKQLALTGVKLPCLDLARVARSPDKCFITAILDFSPIPLALAKESAT